MTNPLFHRWIKVTFAGWCLGFALALALLALASALGLGDARFPIGLGMGVGVGLAQRTVVRDRLGARTPWAALSALGVTLPFLALDLATRLGFHPPVGIALPACVVIAGLTAGLAQYIILRRHGAGSLLWLPLSALGWTLAAGTVVFNDRLLPRIPGILGALLYVAVVLMGGLFLGIATGFALRGRGDPPAPAFAIKARG
jgi:hypothetical protein